MDVLVSIVVPCYNQAHFLDEVLQSVVEQTYTHWECIIVNDGSPDKTEQIAKNWLEKDARFKYLYKENGGLSSARNSGIKISNGEFILPLDSDDILHQDYLKKLIPELIKDQSLAIVSCYRKFFINDISNIIYEHTPRGRSYHSLLYENILMPCSLYRKKCWEEVGGYDESMKKGFEDWEFWIAITKRGWEFKIVEEFLFFYRKSQNSMLTDTLKNHLETNMEYVYNKHKEIYIEKYETTMKYLFYLINKHRVSETKIRNSFEYKIGKIINKPFKTLKNIFK
jgi:glycosyltransferase involved in cell wall biosynthesis